VADVLPVVEVAAHARPVVAEAVDTPQQAADITETGSI
jgi:hypothetical protein